MIDITYCASDCTRTGCERHQENAPLAAVEATLDPYRVLRCWADLSPECEDYQPEGE